MYHSIIFVGSPLPGKWTNMPRPEIDLGGPKQLTRHCPDNMEMQEEEEDFISKGRGLSLLNLLRKRTAPLMTRNKVIEKKSYYGSGPLSGFRQKSTVSQGTLHFWTYRK